MFQVATIALASSNIVRETLVIEEWVVDFLQPTANTRKEPFKIPEGRRGVKYMINGSYPGPTIRANENDMLEITVVNRLFSEATTIHWHGIHPLKQPYMDGARDVTQAPILPGQSFTYRFNAFPPGTHYYHSHMDAVQGARGIRGPLIVQRAEDPVRAQFAYDEELVVFMSDEWRDPSACLKLEGAMPGNDVCADIRHASFNGAFGNGSRGLPFPLLRVQRNKCYRGIGRRVARTPDEQSIDQSASHACGPHDGTDRATVLAAIREKFGSEAAFDQFVRTHLPAVLERSKREYSSNLLNVAADALERSFGV